MTKKENGTSKDSLRQRKGFVRYALQLSEPFESIYRDDYEPNRETLPKGKIKVQRDEKEKTDFLTAARSNGTGRYPGVSKSRKRKTYISCKGTRYVLGYFTEKNDAIAPRKMAEKQLREAPASCVAC